MRYEQGESGREKPSETTAAWEEKGGGEGEMKMELEAGRDVTGER